MCDVIEIEITGKPEPAGSKTAGAVYRKDRDTGLPVPVVNARGRVIVNTRDANPDAKPWKEVVKWEAKTQYGGPLLDGPLGVEITFFRKRPKGHFGSGRNATLLKSSAPVYPTGKPDVLKLARAIEDALTGEVWRDDALIVDERIAKRYTTRGEFHDAEYTLVRVWAIETVIVGDLVAKGLPAPPAVAEVYGQLSLVAA